MFNLDQFRKTGTSSIAGLLDLPPSRVSENNIPDAPEPLRNPFRDDDEPASYESEPASQPQSKRRPAYTDPDEYIPLTEDEIQAKADAKVEMIAAAMGIISTIINAYAAKQQLKKGDKELIRKWEKERARTGSEPVYAPNHPYYEARQRYEEFENELAEIESRAELSDAQRSLLHRAVLADIRAKDAQRRLRNFGIYETAGEIMVAKLTESIMAMLIAAAAKSFTR
ncbi:hypothetical protein [Fibrella forsythiae]|uniref:Uncharacterized protein n=1 Tax=Fibrella forsythiae TaxID=2817061 RepID=A0ABS3JMF1_9BACT|nr:hypothetical protein [Fibrella forsythiae]MBO0951186.1 hypothetical protein [Fibrella forsythiae]